MSEQYGKVAQVIGPVVDVAFEGDNNIVPQSIRLSKSLALMAPR